jgi:hypothetical protein
MLLSRVVSAASRLLREADDGRRTRMMSSLKRLPSKLPPPPGELSLSSPLARLLEEPPRPDLGSGGGEGRRLQWRHVSGSAGLTGVVGFVLGLFEEGEEDVRWRMARTLSASWALVLALRPRLMPLLSMGSEQAQ